MHMKGNWIVDYSQQWQLEDSSGTFCTPRFSDAMRQRSFRPIFWTPCMYVRHLLE